MDQRIRHHLRKLIWIAWKKPIIRNRNLVKLGIDPERAWKSSCQRKRSLVEFGTIAHESVQSRKRPFCKIRPVISPLYGDPLNEAPIAVTYDGRCERGGKPVLTRLAAQQPKWLWLAFSMALTLFKVFSVILNRVIRELQFRVSLFLACTVIGLTLGTGRLCVPSAYLCRKSGLPAIGPRH